MKIILPALVAVFLCVPLLAATAEPSDPAGMNFTPVAGSGLARASSGARAIAIAKRYIGRNPTGQRMLWCQDFINMVERQAGAAGTRSRASRSVLQYGTRIQASALRAGDWVWRSRGGGRGHSEYFVRWANPDRTRYIALTGNSCGSRGSRYVCEVTRPIGGGRIFIRPDRQVRS